MNKFSFMEKKSFKRKVIIGIVVYITIELFASFNAMDTGVFAGIMLAVFLEVKMISLLLEWIAGFFTKNIDALLKCSILIPVASFVAEVRFYNTMGAISSDYLVIGFLMIITEVYKVRKNKTLALKEV